MIYEIVCNVTGERYIGSTFRPIEKRIQGHKHDAKRNISIASRHIINRNDYTYSILENVDTDSKDELRQCELKWYNELENINELAPYVDTKAYKKQRYEDNKAKILLKAKEYYKEHAEEKKESVKEYYKQNAEKKKERAKEYYKQNAEKKKEYQREYYKTSTQIKMSA